jgi:hypothetical protein
MTVETLRDGPGWDDPETCMSVDRTTGWTCGRTESDPLHREPWIRTPIGHEYVPPDPEPAPTTPGADR